MNKSFNDFKNLTTDEVIENIKNDQGNGFISVDDTIENTNKVIAIKDIHSQTDKNVTIGSQMLEDYVANYDAEVVALLKANGYAIAGRTNMDEFAMGSTNKTSYYGGVANAHNANLVSGGSSGGSAYAVAKGLVPAATGTDTGGSIRQPAAFNGIYGMKPTYGLISRYGTLAFASSFDTVGALSNTIEDNMQIISDLAVNDHKDQTNFVPDNFRVDDLIGKPLTGLKAAYVKEWLEADINPEIKDAIKGQIKKLQDLGVEFEELSLPLSKFSVELYILLAYSEASSNLNRYDGIRFGNNNEENNENIYKGARNVFGSEVKKRLVIGTYMISSEHSREYYEHAQIIRQKLSEDIFKGFEKYDFVVGPTTPVLPFEKNYVLKEVEGTLADQFAIPANLAGIPAMSVPIGYSSSNLPIGMQIMADRYNENRIYQVAKALEGINND